MPCSSVWVSEFKQQPISFSAVNILPSITATLGNSLILVALHKESPSIRHPNSCIIVWKPLICWLVLLPSLSMLPTGCPWFTSTEVLSIRKGRNRHTNLCIIWGVFVDDDGHKNGPTSRHVVGTEMQRDCNFKTHVSHFSYCLDCMSSR